MQRCWHSNRCLTLMMLACIHKPNISILNCKKSTVACHIFLLSDYQSANFLQECRCISSICSYLQLLLCIWEFVILYLSEWRKLLNAIMFVYIFSSFLLHLFSLMCFSCCLIGKTQKFISVYLKSKCVRYFDPNMTLKIVCKDRMEISVR